MTIQERLSPENIDIARLHLETPKPRERIPFDPEKEITADDWEHMAEKLEADRTRNDWRDFSWLAIKMKLLFPERASELNLDTKAWQGMKHGLERDRTANQWNSFAWQAMNMKLLAAAEVTVTDKGIAVTMSKPTTDLSPSTPPLPEVKKF